MLTAIEAHQKIDEKAKSSIKSTSTVKEMKVDEWVRQGDIYLRKIDKITGTKEVKSRQLAPGTSKGSRHIIADSPHVKLFEGYSGKEIGDFMKGPQVEAKESFTVTHPEHAHIELPAGNYQITYQMDFARKERVRD